jgi:sec-independent protein translocase protein TatC
MFYFKELYFRFIFIIYAIICIYTYCYIFKNNIINIIIAPFILLNVPFNNTFIQTDPSELFFVILNIILIITCFFIIPYILWTILDFFKTAFYINEYKIIKRYIVFFSLIVYSFNVLALFLLFPLVWNFFSSFNDISFEYINFNKLIKVNTYMYFLCNFFKITNMFFVFLIIIYILVFIKGIRFLLKFKKFFMVINILVATFLSPPDVFIQIFIFLFLQVILEIFHFFFLYELKTNKEAY